MVKFPEANRRMFSNKVVCRRCKTVVKGATMKVIAGKVRCRDCKGMALRPKRKK